MINQILTLEVNVPFTEHNFDSDGSVEEADVFPSTGYGNR